MGLEPEHRRRAGREGRCQVTRLILPAQLVEERRRQLAEFDARTAAFQKDMEEADDELHEAIMRSYEVPKAADWLFVGGMVALAVIVALQVTGVIS